MPFGMVLPQHLQAGSSLALSAATILCGCTQPRPEAHCARFEFLEGVAEPPAVVKIAFQLSTCDGEPIDGKFSTDFDVAENGESISEVEAAADIVDDPQAFAIKTILMLDLSGSVIGNVDELVGAANTFIGSIAGEQEVAIYVFDGRPEPQLIVDFTDDSAALTAGLFSLLDFESSDSSTNLNGALVAGLGLLDAARATASDGGLFAGSMAVFTDGTDQASYVSDASAVQSAVASSHTVFTIGLGAEIDRLHLENIGASGGAVFAANLEALTSAFGEVAESIRTLSASYYILAYCSPKRSGMHEMTLSLRGFEGEVSYSFAANNFGGGCDPGDFLGG